MEFFDHCMVKINESLVALTGGRNSIATTLLVDLSNNFTMKEGPPLINGRQNHACGTFEFDGKTMVILAGNGIEGFDSTLTEIWDPSSNDGWVQGNKTDYFFINWLTQLIFP